MINTQLWLTEIKRDLELWHNRVCQKSDEELNVIGKYILEISITRKLAEPLVRKFRVETPWSWSETTETYYTINIKHTFEYELNNSLDVRDPQFLKEVLEDADTLPNEVESIQQRHPECGCTALTAVVARHALTKAVGAAMA